MTRCTSSARALTAIPCKFLCDALGCVQQKAPTINRRSAPEMTTPKTAQIRVGRPSETKRTAYLVLGMHRSGTSAVTQLLALAGANLPENVMAGDEHNAKGYFEPWKIAILND